MRPLFCASAIVLSSLMLSACGGSKAPPPPRLPVTNVTNPAPPGSLLYRFPLVGNWRVFRTHYGVTNDQAYALDLIADAPFGFAGKKNNREFPSYNQPVVADAAGVVVIAVDGVPDNIPGATNVYDMHGNYIVIDHQNGEYSLFAHLIPGSLRVRPGTAVTAGMEIGRCGNSGHSSMPHLHWQVMSSANATGAIGIPPRYAPYERNGLMTTELPQKNDKLIIR
jgi:murein DD-endopeptidase MepM/ murein hydrolase activator NlpD